MNRNDIWNKYMESDNKPSENTNKKIRIFPTLKNINNYDKIQIDDESYSFITLKEIADYISKIICANLIENNINPGKSVMVDLTAGVGGNTLSFSKYFNKIHAVEIDNNRSEYLKNNIDVYELTNTFVYNKCCNLFIDENLLNIGANTVFVDPPWGGASYKEHDTILLKLGDINLEQVVINIINKIKQENINKFIFIKLPKNYNINHIYSIIKNYAINQKIIILNKMLIYMIHIK